MWQNFRHSRLRGATCTHSIHLPPYTTSLPPLIPFNTPPQRIIARRYNWADVTAVGGLPAVMRMLLNAGMLHGDCLTVTGKTVAENLAGLKEPPTGQVRTPCVTFVSLAAFQ